MSQSSHQHAERARRCMNVVSNVWLNDLTPRQRAICGPEARNRVCKTILRDKNLDHLYFGPPCVDAGSFGRRMAVQSRDHVFLMFKTLYHQAFDSMDPIARENKEEEEEEEYTEQTYAPEYRPATKTSTPTPPPSPVAQAQDDSSLDAEPNAEGGGLGLLFGKGDIEAIQRSWQSLCSAVVQLAPLATAASNAQKDMNNQQHSPAPASISRPLGRKQISRWEKRLGRRGNMLEETFPVSPLVLDSKCLPK